MVRTLSVVSPPEKIAEDYVALAAAMMDSSIRDRDMMSSNFRHQISSIAEYKGYDGVSSRKDTKTFKSGRFIDVLNGNRVYKKEVDYDSSSKVTDKRRGVTTHYETQVKHRQTTTYDNPSSRSGGRKSSSKTGYGVAKPSKSSSGGRLCSKTDYAVAKSDKSSSELQIKMASGIRTEYTIKGSGEGKSCSKTGYAVAKSDTSSGKVQIKMAVGTSTKYTSKVSGTGGSKSEIVAEKSSSSENSGGGSRSSSSKVNSISKKTK